MFVKLDRSFPPSFRVKNDQKIIKKKHLVWVLPKNFKCQVVPQPRSFTHHSFRVLHDQILLLFSLPRHNLLYCLLGGRSWSTIIQTSVSSKLQFIHPRKLTWIPKMMVWKRWLLLNMAIFGIYVKFLGCKSV